MKTLQLLQLFTLLGFLGLSEFDVALLDPRYVCHYLTGGAFVRVQIGDLHHLAVLVCPTVVDSVDPALVQEND